MLPTVLNLSQEYCEYSHFVNVMELLKLVTLTITQFSIAVQFSEVQLEILRFYFDEKQIIFGHDKSRSTLFNQMIVNLPEKSVVIAEMKIGLTVNPSTFPLLKLPCHPFCPTFKSIWIN